MIDSVIGNYDSESTITIYEVSIASDGWRLWPCNFSLPFALVVFERSKQVAMVVLPASLSLSRFLATHRVHNKCKHIHFLHSLHHQGMPFFDDSFADVQSTITRSIDRSVVARRTTTRHYLSFLVTVASTKCRLLNGFSFPGVTDSKQI